MNPTKTHRYAVVVFGKSAPTKFHASEGDAIAEAIRLLKNNQGCNAIVVEVRHLLSTDVKVEAIEELEEVWINQSH